MDNETLNQFEKCDLHDEIKKVFSGNFEGTCTQLDFQGHLTLSKETISIAVSSGVGSAYAALVSRAPREW